MAADFGYLKARPDESETATSLQSSKTGGRREGVYRFLRTEPSESLPLKQKLVKY